MKMTNMKSLVAFETRKNPKPKTNSPRNLQKLQHLASGQVLENELLARLM